MHSNICRRTLRSIWGIFLHLWNSRKDCGGWITNQSYRAGVWKSNKLSDSIRPKFNVSRQGIFAGKYPSEPFTDLAPKVEPSSRYTRSRRHRQDADRSGIRLSTSCRLQTRNLAPRRRTHFNDFWSRQIFPRNKLYSSQGWKSTGGHRASSIEVVEPSR